MGRTDINRGRSGGTHVSAAYASLPPSLPGGVCLPSFAGQEGFGNTPAGRWWRVLLLWFVR